jgi:endoglucanase
VLQSTQTLMDNPNGLGSGDEFAELVKTTGATVTGAWGGHFDAGDWDRRVQHLWYLRAALDLVSRFPETFARLDLGIPESGDAVPDLVDEGLWDLDLYRRLQQPDGGIRGGIDGTDGTDNARSSWTQTQKLYAYAADPWSSYIYAGVAAQTAQVLATYDATRAATYRTSALAAMAWAERQPVPAAYADDVKAQRGVAAAALFSLTGDPAWQDVVAQATPFAARPVDLLGCHGHDVCDAAWIIARTAQPGLRADLRANAITSLRANAATLVAKGATTRFGWTMEHPDIPLIWGLGPATPKTVGLLRGFAVGADRAACTTALRSATFSLGANPLDTVFVTGLGQRNVRHPLVVDVTTGGLPLWPGIPVFGMHQLGRDSDAWIARYFLRPAGTTPDPAATPYLQQWFDLPNVAPFNEYTVYQSMTEALSTFGTLAAVTC